MPTLHAELPEKHENQGFPTIGNVPSVSELPQTALKHDAYYVEDEDLFYMYNGGAWQAILIAPYYSPVDGHFGHAGLGTEWAELDPQTSGVWTCHTSVVDLPVGFYVIQGEAIGYMTNDDYDFQDFDGWGSIRTVMLTRLPELVAGK
jgi:hypothetical protein